ncbi:MAG: family 43 glycosylhydrolase [Chitinispirillales bacterium]|jgi:hypothetical protein|nr:family 43 glycosylhydrolase [Chitinispirillales bacterium]
MNKTIIKALLASSVMAAAVFSQAPENIYGDNPFVHTAFTADPAPVVFKDPRYSDRLFVYTSHDEPNASWFEMRHLMCYSTTDMVNWTDHGAVMSDVDFSWAKDSTFWASQVIDRNGKFYAYVPIERGAGGGPQIGVGVSDSPFGPFADALNKPLVSGNWNGDIDPTVFIDDNGQAYLYWGNPKLKYARLKENMIELDGSVVEVPMTAASFGARSGEPDADRPASYEEGPWLIKRNAAGLGNPYYLIYAGGPISEHLAYSTAPSPSGPWTYGGVIMPTGSGLAFTNHPGVVDYKGRSYLFYHDQRLTWLEGHTGGFTRSVAAAEFTYNSDGSIPRVASSATGPAAIAAFDPFVKFPATTINRAVGVKTGRINPNDKSDPRMRVYDIKNDGYIRLKAVDFGSGAASFTATAACAANSNARIELRTGGVSGRLIGTLNLSSTGGANNWLKQTAGVDNVTGIQELYLVFKGQGCAFEDWQFGAACEDPEPAPTQGNLVKDGIFPGASLGDNWNLANMNDGAAAAASVRCNKVNVVITSVGEHIYQPQLIQQGITLERGKSYKLTFKASAEANRTITAQLERLGGEGIEWGYMYGQKTFNLTTGETTHELEFDMTDPTDDNVQLAFNFGGSTHDVTISDAALVSTGATSVNPKQTAPAKKPLMTVRGRTLNVNAPADSKMKIRVVDMRGKTVARFNTMGSARFSLTKLPAGRYFVEIRGAGIKNTVPTALK